MHAPNDNIAPKGLRGWWASLLRSGMQRIISPWEYRHLRAWAGVRIAGGIALVGLGAVTLSFGGNDRKTYGWTMVFLALAAAQFSFATWELAIAHSASART
jgi:NhaP-type Na+/H+ or K+/H+ antiporter